MSSRLNPFSSVHFNYNKSVSLYLEVLTIKKIQIYASKLENSTTMPDGIFKFRHKINKWWKTTQTSKWNFSRYLLYPGSFMSLAFWVYRNDREKEYGMLSRIWCSTACNSLNTFYPYNVRYWLLVFHQKKWKWNMNLCVNQQIGLKTKMREKWIRSRER